MPPSSRRGSTLVAAGIFLSRVSGLVRERAIAHFLGTSFAADAFRAALRIPNLLQNLLGEGVLSASFIPVYSRLLSEGRREEAGRVAGAIAGLLMAVTGALIVVGVVFAEPITRVIAAGFTGRTLDLAVALVRIITPGVGFLVLSAWCLGVLNSHRRFFLAYVAPVLWNAAQIAALVTAGLLLGRDGRPDVLVALATALGWGVLAGGVLQFLVQLPAVLRLVPGLRPSLRARLPGVRRTLRAFVPIVGGRGVVQLTAYVDTLLASFLVAGALAALGYAQVLYLLPISLFGMSVAAAELPELSSAAPVDQQAVRRRLDDGLARVAFFVVPTIAGYLVAGDLLVGALFRTGQFGVNDTLQVWAILAGYSLALLASTSSRLLQSVLYGAGDAVTPAKVSALRVILSASVGAALMLQLDRIGISAAGLQVVGELPAFGPLPEAVREQAPDLPRLGALGLALGAAAGAWLEYGLLRRAARRRAAGLRIGGGQLSRIAAAAAAAAVVAVVVRAATAGLGPLLAAPLVALPAGGVYLLVAYRLGLGEARQIARAFSRMSRRQGGRT
jgi:putative peptidoglycan lipid II flippase